MKRVIFWATICMLLSFQLSCSKNDELTKEKKCECEKRSWSNTNGFTVWQSVPYTECELAGAVSGAITTSDIVYNQFGQQTSYKQFQWVNYENLVNNSPDNPTLISPTNGSVEMISSPYSPISLNWSCTDPNNDIMTYDIYIGKSNPPTTLLLNQKETTLIPSFALEMPTTYYWKVVAKDYFGSTTSGSVWSFTTSKKNSETVTDIDGNVYNTVQIGTQVWIKENLKTVKYRNGDPIINVNDDNTWHGLTSGAFCWYNKDIANKNIYGALYNYFAITDSRSICPVGWHIPNNAEWGTLMNFLGGQLIAGGKLKEIGFTHWSQPNTGATNETDFSALPGGIRDYYGWFISSTARGYFWSSTVNTTPNAYYMDKSNAYLSPANLFSSDKVMGFSVRCIKD